MKLELKFEKAYLAVSNDESYLLQFRMSDFISLSKENQFQRKE